MSKEDSDGVVDRFEAVTSEPGEIGRLTRAMFGVPLRVERDDGRPPSLRLAQVATAGLGVQRVTWNGDGRCQIEPVGRFLCIRLRQGTYAVDQGDGRTVHRPGTTFLVDPHRPVDAEVVAADLDSFTIDLELLERAVEQIAPGRPGSLRYRHAVPVTPQLAATWDRVLDELSAALTTDDLVATNPLIRAGLIHRVVATACAAFDLTGDHRDERPATPRSLRRALTYMDDHLADPISIGDIAAAAGLSTRGLHDVFRRTLGTSPLAYLRRARLHAVHHELARADDTTTVADSARRWGFTHLGRFAHTYRAEFGQLPSHTLRH